MHKVSKVKKVPEIRFEGFAEPWEQRKFDEVFDCTIPNNTLSRAELNYESGSVRNIHYGDILIKYGSVVDVQKDEIPFVTGKSSYDFKGALLQDGDILIADTAEDETTGKACEISNSQGVDVVSGLHTMVCRPRNKMALGYFGYYLNSSVYHYQLLPLMQGIKVLSLSRTNVQKTIVSYPKSKSEQQLIADCFHRLDHLITLHQNKNEKLVALKKAMLEKMFPQKGNNVPEVRFAGFTGPWEKCKFSDIVETHRGLTYSPSDISSNDGIRVLRSSNIIDDSFTLSNDDVFVRREAINIEYARENDILITAANGSSRLVGKHAIINKITEKSTVHGGFMLLGKTRSPYFINASMSSYWYKQFVELFVAGGNGAIGNLNKNDLDNQELLVPSEEEQRKIGAYFRNLDHLITLQQRKCESLKHIKAALLQKMFV